MYGDEGLSSHLDVEVEERAIAAVRRAAPVVGHECIRGVTLSDRSVVGGVDRRTLEPLLELDHPDVHMLQGNARDDGRDGADGAHEVEHDCERSV